jgi:hypothetical protein
MDKYLSNSTHYEIPLTSYDTIGTCTGPILVPPLVCFLACWDDSGVHLGT